MVLSNFSPQESSRPPKLLQKILRNIKPLWYFLRLCRPRRATDAKFAGFAAVWPSGRVRVQDPRSLDFSFADLDTALVIPSSSTRSCFQPACLLFFPLLLSSSITSERVIEHLYGHSNLVRAFLNQVQSMQRVLYFLPCRGEDELGIR